MFRYIMPRGGGRDQHSAFYLSLSGEATITSPIILGGSISHPQSNPPRVKSPKFPTAFSPTSLKAPHCPISEAQCFSVQNAAFPLRHATTKKFEYPSFKATGHCKCLCEVRNETTTAKSSFPTIFLF